MFYSFWCVIIKIYFMQNISLTSKQQALEIEKIYKEAIQKLKTLGKERVSVVLGYIKELETQKIKAIRTSLGLPPQ
jgi:hypothetical protein